MVQESGGPRSRRTREAILDAARERFAADGFERTTVRAVAAGAGIDPSMVMRYFGNKQGLFAAASSLDLSLPDLLDVPRGELGRAAVEHFLVRWEEAGSGEALRILLATAVTDRAAAGKVQEIFSVQLQPFVAAAGQHGGGEAARRAALVATQVLGLALCRYVLRLPSVVAMDHSALVAWMGPVIQRYLTDPQV